MDVKQHNIATAKRLCADHGCSEKIRKIHFDQIVSRAWNPHPSEQFISWWQTQPEFKRDGVEAVRARNCKVFTDRFKEHRSFGIA